MKNKRTSKLKVIMILLTIAVFFIGSATYLVFWNNTPGIAQNQSSNLIDKLRTLQVNGGTLELTENELNSTFKTLIDKPIVKNGIVINGAYVNIKKDKMTVFTPVKYKGMNLLPNITGSISYENDRLNFIITSVKIGKFSIPKSILLNKLKNYSNDDIIIDGDRIEISKYLLPFSAEDIYLSDNKVFAQIAKIGLPQSNGSITANGSNTYSKQNNPSHQGGQNSGGTTSGNNSENENTSVNNNQTNNNPSSNTQTPSPVTPQAAQVSALNKVSSQLNSVIANVQTDQERQMIKKVQSVVREVAANPNYPYQNQANEVKAWYQSLKPEEKIHMKDAILNNVNVMDILKLINIFGV